MHPKEALDESSEEILKVTNLCLDWIEVRVFLSGSCIERLTAIDKQR